MNATLGLTLACKFLPLSEVAPLKHRNKKKKLCNYYLSKLYPINIYDLILMLVVKVNSKTFQLKIVVLSINFKFNNLYQFKIKTP